MFAFLKLQPAFSDDPLQSPAAASAWLRHLPLQDDAGRQRNVQAALHEVPGMGGGIEHLRLLRNGAESGTLCPTIQQEYLCVLLEHRVNSGNLCAKEFELVSERLREWSCDITLDTLPRTEASFVVDLEGKTGLVCR